MNTGTTVSIPTAAALLKSIGLASVGQAEVTDHQEDRNRDRDRGHEAKAQDRRGPVVAGAEAQPRKGIPGGNAEYQRDQRRDPGDDDRVLDEREVALLVDDVAVVRR